VGIINKLPSACLRRAPIVPKAFFIVPNDAQNYKINKILKQFTNLKL